MSASRNLTPDQASIKYAGMIVLSPTARIGIIIHIRYVGGTRTCQVLFRTGEPRIQWWPGDELIPAPESEIKKAGYSEPPRKSNKAVRYDW